MSIMTKEFSREENLKNFHFSKFARCKTMRKAIYKEYKTICYSSGTKLSGKLEKKFLSLSCLTIDNETRDEANMLNWE